MTLEEAQHLTKLQSKGMRLSKKVLKQIESTLNTKPKEIPIEVVTRPSKINFLTRQRLEQEAARNIHRQ